MEKERRYCRKRGAAPLVHSSPEPSRLDRGVHLADRSKGSGSVYRWLCGHKTEAGRGRRKGDAKKRDVGEVGGASGQVSISYHAKAVKLSEAVRWLGDRRYWRTAPVMTDSDSFVRKADEGAEKKKTADIRERVWKVHKGGWKIVLVWVPGHC